MAFNRRDDTTKFYVDQIGEIHSRFSTLTNISSSNYKELISMLPCDLAARLRMVPDTSLGPRLAHLLAIYDVISNQLPILDSHDYGVVSVEGSNASIPVDCDLIVYSNEDNCMIFVDFTATRNHRTLASKENILLQNIELNSFKGAKQCVYRFTPRHYTVEIDPTISSSCCGSEGLRFVDALCVMPVAYRNMYFENCKEVYRRVNHEIALIDNDSAPGDYKQFEPSSDLLATAIKLATSQNNAESLTFLKRAEAEDDQYHPYFSGIKALARKAHKFKSVIPIEAAEVYESRNLVSCLESLKSNWLAKALHYATMTSNVVLVEESDSLAILPTFPEVTANNMLSQSSGFKVAVQHKKGHVFKIIFSEAHVDAKLKKIMEKSGIRKEKAYFSGEGIITDDQANSWVTEAISRYDSDVSYFQSLTSTDARDDIWKKILTISALASNDMDNFGRSTHSLLESLTTAIRQSHLGSCLSHHYEVCKSVIASLKVRPGDNTYYVGVNGSYDSVTIVKMSSTLDSFKRGCFSTIFKSVRSPDSRHTRYATSTTNGVSQTSFYSTDPNHVSYNLRVPYLLIALASWEIECNMTSGAVAAGLISQTIIDSALTVLINRDQFAQVSEQVRYFYMSSIGYGGSSAEIVDKTTFMTTRHHWEVIYILRMYKLGASLSTISSASKLKAIENKETKELSVVFPHTSFPSRSFSQTVSSMYICNIYNKFRAFHEVSEAICYNEIVEERDIYLNRVKENSAEVSGMSNLMSSLFDGSVKSAITYIFSPRFLTEEVEFALSAATIKSKRYCGSSSYIVGATLTHVEVPESTIDIIYDKLNKAPIEACTMRGSMESGESTQKHQGVRAASSILEGFIEKMGRTPASVNKSVLGAVYLMDAIKEKMPTFTILSCVIDQFNDGSVVYRYRIVQKDQKGFREVSVLNFHFRLGALMVEIVSRELATSLADVDIVNNPNKDKIIEDTLSDSFRKDATMKGTYCYDNSDQKRWGPNHNMNFFAYSMVAMLAKDPGLMRLVNRVLDLTFDKRAKYPESLLDLITKKNITFSRSKDIDQFIRHALPRINSNSYELKIYQGMCQGIFQQTSSNSHAIKLKCEADIIAKIVPSAVLRGHSTSDDVIRLLHIPPGNDVVAVVKVAHCVGLRVGNLVNIVRSNPKSAFNFMIAELNSIFFKRGNMATPALKQRISKVDVGMGVNHIEDYLSALASASNTLSAGGSYMGAVIVSVLNMVLHTEQWLRWGFVTSDSYYKPVEMGGFPVIEPISTIISGGVANFYQRVDTFISSENYSRLITNSLLCPPEELSLVDFSRAGSDRVKKSLRLDHLTILKGTGPMGIFQMVRTDRKLSQFERRHGLSQWPIPEDFISLKRDSPAAGDFLFALFRGSSVSTLETDIGVNSFYLRMAEPWASFSRPCLRLSQHSPFASIFKKGQEMLSHEEFFNTLSGLSPADASIKLDSLSRSLKAQPEYELMESQLSVRLRDAKAIKTFLSSQEAEAFKISHCSPTIQRVVLRGHSVADSDSYLLAIVKSLSGAKSRGVINEFKKLPTAYDSINIPEPSNPLSLAESIVIGDNVIALYNKFIRRDTKMILPNKVETLVDLCLDVIKNKFTEVLGMTLEGAPVLDTERSKSHAYTKWYQDLLKYSSSFEKSVAHSVLRGEAPPAAVVAVSSARAIITKHDLFEVVGPTAPSRAVLLDARTKESLVGSIRTWLPAKVRLLLSKQTISLFIAGRLTYAHDYYFGGNTFYRYPKDKYLTIMAGGIKGMHIIKTTAIANGPNRRISYRHIFLFPEAVEGRIVTAEINPTANKEDWLLSLLGELASTTAPARGIHKKIPKHNSKVWGNNRKSLDEVDYYSFEVLSQGTEITLNSNPGSLAINFKSANWELPVTYLNPDSIDHYSIGYELKHSDLVLTVEIYDNLEKTTGGFNKDRIRSWPELSSVLDFILVNSSVETPQWLIKKNLSPIINADLTGVQLDILRTFLIRDKRIGVGYSSHRFNNHLLNMGHRRNHNFNYMCKGILGNRVDQDSDDWEQLSAEEEVLITGRTAPNTFNDLESVGEVQDMIRGDSEANADGDTKAPSEYGSEGEGFDWADEVMSSLNKQVPAAAPNNQTALDDVGFLFDDSDTDSVSTSSDQHGDGSPSSVKPLLNSTDLSGHRSTTSKPGGLSFMEAAFQGLNFDEIFDVESDDGSEDAQNKLGVTDTLDEIFRKALAGEFDNIRDIKDQTLKSEKSGHTVGATVESARSIINFLKSWVETAGSGVDLNQGNSLTKNVSSVTSMYVMFYRAGALGSVNPLDIFFKLDGYHLPVELSALAVIDSVYS
jgi:hypothetical protein